jgi:hypothetical protein
MGRGEILTEKHEGRDHLENLGVGGRTILNWMLRKWG